MTDESPFSGPSPLARRQAAQLFKSGRQETVTHRERQLLTVIRQAGEISRSELIQRTGLPGVPVFRGTEDLAARGLVEIGETVARGRGQPSALVRLRPNALATVGLSVMTDYAEALLMDFSGAVRAVRDLTMPGMSCDRILDGLTEFIADSTAETGISPSSIYSIGVGLAGFFVGEGSKINPAAELDDWALVDLGAIIQARTGYPALVENGASAAAVGERLLGVGRWADSFGYMNLASGFGGGIVVGGELLRGRNGNGGEIAGLVEAVGLRKPDLESLREVLARHGVATSGINDLVGRYDDDWPGIDEWIETNAPAFRAVANAFRYLIDCEAIVIGGRAPRPLAERIVAAIAWPDQPVRRDRPAPRPKIVPAEISSQSTAIGAAALPLKQGYFL